MLHQWRSSVVAKPGHGPPSSAQNTKGSDENLPKKEKNMLYFLGWPAQQFG
jgi:hypothetical protein